MNENKNILSEISKEDIKELDKDSRKEDRKRITNCKELIKHLCLIDMRIARLENAGIRQ